MQPKFKYWSCKPLLKSHPNAHYYMVIGERSNGKTYSCLNEALERYFATGEQFAYIRRFGEDIRKKHMQNLFSGLVENGVISKLSGGKWSSVDYTSGKFRLARTTDDGVEYSEDAIGYAFDLNSMEHYKSISFPKITFVIFDEFISRYAYLPNEFLLFTNALSTIIRLRCDVKIFMLANTVNKYCPYFTEMGLSHIKDQEQGKIDVYHYGKSKLEVVVEYCASSEKDGGKPSDVYFAFDNPELQMITTGTWEIAIYPHLPHQYKPKDVAGVFFVDFDGEMLQGNIIASPDDLPFIFFHRKTTEIKRRDDIVYQQVPSPSPYARIGIDNYTDKLSTFIKRAMLQNRIFYSENEVGEIWRNYVIWSRSQKLVN